MSITNGALTPDEQTRSGDFNIGTSEFPAAYAYSNEPRAIPGNSGTVTPADWQLNRAVHGYVVRAGDDGGQLTGEAVLSSMSLSLQPLLTSF